MARGESGDAQTGSVLSAITDAALYPRPVWRSERAYVFAAIAGVVGLGNIWRFPYMAGQHGGGSFLLAYLVCVVVIGIPLAALESGAGNLARRSPVGLFRRAAGGAGAVLGWAVIAMTVAIMSYYLVVTGWTLGYAVDAFRGDLVTFTEFTEGYTSLWLFLLVGFGVYRLLLRDVSAIERASLVLLPMLVVVVVGLTVYSQTLDGAGEARSFYFGVDGAALADAATWRAAAGQAFYSIGLGQGILIAYGSFVPAGTKLLRSTAIIALTNAGIAFVSGLMVFGIVFTFGIAPDTGSELSFTAFPQAFAEVRGGALLAIAFFVLLFVAAFTSCMGASIVVMSTVRDQLRLSRRRAAQLTAGTIVVLGTPSALSFTDMGLTVGGLPVLDRVDQVTGSGVIIVLGLTGAAVLAWRLPRRALVASFHTDPVHLGRLTHDPNTTIRWAMVLPFVVALAYGIAMVL
ncbi:MAG: sodium-dependent transporter [Acidimicrobiales bacterium]|nr:sodium-dependent transporter [Acidimicrobiales bacterium]